MEPDSFSSSHCQADPRHEVGTGDQWNQTGVNNQQKQSRCFLVYKVDLPTAAQSNPCLKHAILYMPYSQGDVPMIPRNLLSNVCCPPDLAQWPDNPKFVISPDCSSVMLLHPDNSFSHLALPGAYQSDDRENTDSQGRPLPIPYTRKGHPTKIRNVNVFRSLDIHVLMIGSWCMLNQNNEAKLKICPHAKVASYELVTKVQHLAKEEELEKTIVVVEVKFGSISSITMVDKWQLVLKLRHPPLVTQYQVRLKLKTIVGNKKICSYPSTSSSVGRQLGPEQFGNGQIHQSLTHRLMLNKNCSGRVIEYLMDLRDKDLEQVSFQEQLQVFSSGSNPGINSSSSSCSSSCNSTAQTRQTQPVSSSQQDNFGTNISSTVTSSFVTDSAGNQLDFGSQTSQEFQSFGNHPDMGQNTDDVLRSYEILNTEVSCSCKDGRCMGKDCICVSTASTCTFDCACCDCENPLNVLKVVHKVPLPKLHRDLCMIQNLIKNPGQLIAKVGSNKVYLMPCCQTPVGISEVAKSDVIQCKVCPVVPAHTFLMSWCVDQLIEETAFKHCDVCTICTGTQYTHCNICSCCYDAGPNGTQPCFNCLTSTSSSVSAHHFSQTGGDLVSELSQSVEGVLTQNNPFITDASNHATLSALAEPDPNTCGENVGDADCGDEGEAVGVQDVNLLALMPSFVCSDSDTPTSLFPSSEQTGVVSSDLELHNTQLFDEGDSSQ